MVPRKSWSTRTVHGDLRKVRRRLRENSGAWSSGKIARGSIEHQATTRRDCGQGKIPRR